MLDRHRFVTALSAIALVAALFATYVFARFVFPGTTDAAVACGVPRSVARLVPWGIDLSAIVFVLLWSLRKIVDSAGQWDYEKRCALVILTASIGLQAVHGFGLHSQAIGAAIYCGMPALLAATLHAVLREVDRLTNKQTAVRSARKAAAPKPAVAQPAYDQRPPAQSAKAVDDGMTPDSTDVSPRQSERDSIIAALHAEYGAKLTGAHVAEALGLKAASSGRKVLAAWRQRQPGSAEPERDPQRADPLHSVA